MIKSVVVEYALISPAVLAMLVGKALGEVLCDWRELDEDYFEFTIIAENKIPACKLAKLEKVLAPFV